MPVFGDSSSTFFQGFGANNLLISRQMVCSPNNIGVKDAEDDPFPCVLREGAGRGRRGEEVQK